MANAALKEEYSIDGHEDELMDSAWVAWRLGISVRTLNNKLSIDASKLPPFILIGSGPQPTRRWLRGVVNNWIKQQ